MCVVRDEHAEDDVPLRRRLAGAFTEAPATMMTRLTTQETLDVLQDLLQLSKAGERAYGRARECAHDRRLSLAFLASESERRAVVRQLSEAIESLGGLPQPEGVPAGAFHQPWLGAFETAAQADTQALLDELVASEREVVARTLDALNRPLARRVRALLSAQAATASTNLRRYGAYRPD